MRFSLAASVCLSGLLFFILGFHFDDFQKENAYFSGDTNKDAVEQPKPTLLRRKFFRVDTGEWPGGNIEKADFKRKEDYVHSETEYWIRVLQQSTTGEGEAEVEPPPQQEGSAGTNIDTPLNSRSSSSWISRYFNSRPRGPTLSWHGGRSGSMSWIRQRAQNSRNSMIWNGNRSPATQSRQNGGMTWNGNRASTSRFRQNGWSARGWNGRHNNAAPRSGYSWTGSSNYRYGYGTVRQAGSRFSSNRFRQGFRDLGSVYQKDSAATASRRRHSDNPVELVQAHPVTESKRLHIFVAGFPKCGTTSLLYAFKDHKETVIGDRENCVIANPSLTDMEARTKLDDALSTLTNAEDSSIKSVVKCPSGIRRQHAIERLRLHSPDVRIVIGVRHPVKYFQSFYNYRVTEAHTKGEKDEPIPSVEELVGSAEWKGVSTDSARFELFLMQLGKTDMSPHELQELSSRKNMAVTKSPAKVFLYSLEQLEDNDEKRSGDFRQDMQNFLQLEERLEPFQNENKNHFVGDKAFPETIDICNEDFDHIRGLLVFQGKKTQEWITSQFLSNPDVFVGNRDHFQHLLEMWGMDPCIRGESELSFNDSTPETLLE